MIDQAKATEILNDAADLWEDVLDEDVTQDEVNHVEEMLDLASSSFDRADWTGAWMWAGNAIGMIRERMLPPPATA